MDKAWTMVPLLVGAYFIYLLFDIVFYKVVFKNVILEF